MRKNKKSCSIPEFCRNNNFRTLEFYKMPRRHPELARKMKANSAGERVLDEEAMRTAMAILRKEKIEDRRKILFSFRETRRSPQRFSRLWAESICPVMKSAYPNILQGAMTSKSI